MSATDYVSTTETSHHDDHDHDHGDEDDTQAILIAKGVAMCVLCVVSICMGLIPLQLAKWFKWTSNEISPSSLKVIEILLGFGGGVLLSTTFLHILPEVSHGVEDLVESGSLPEISVSWAELLMCIGFFLMYLIEEIVHVYLRRDDKKRNAARSNLNSEKDVNRSTNELVENGHLPESQPDQRHGFGHGHCHMPLPAEDDNGVVSSLRGLLIVLGLSVHELFEGLAVGLSSSAQDVWYLFGAVAAHKFVIAFCIGIELISSRTQFYLIIIYICTYAVVSPIGIGIAMILTTASSIASGVTVIILQGLATGTLLYVVFFEILRKQSHGLRQYLSVFIGFLLMVAIQFTLGHEHSHSHSR